MKTTIQRKPSTGKVVSG